MATMNPPNSPIAQSTHPSDSVLLEWLEASAAIYDLESVEEFVVHHPIGRLLEPGEIASAVTTLTEVGASAITGAVLAVDGGMTV